MQEISQCIHGCKHFYGLNDERTGYKCKAFKEIPEEILFNKFDHRQEYEGDGGIRFKLRDDAPIKDFFDGYDTDPEIPPDV